MAGAITFTLLGDSTPLVAATERANLAMNGLKITVADINRAFNQAASGHRATANGIRETGKQVLSTTNALRSMSGMFVLLGGQVAPQFAAAMMTIQMGFQSIRLGAEAAKVSIGTFAARLAGMAGAAAAPVLGGLAIGAIGYQMNQERWNEEETFAGLQKQKTALMAKIQDLMSRGKLSGKDGVGMTVGLILASGSVEALAEKIKTVGDRLVGIEVDKAIARGFLMDLNRLDATLSAQALTGKARAMAELDIEAADLRNKADALAKGAGVPLGDTESRIDAYVKQRVSAINEQFTDEKGRSPATSTFKRPQFSALERMGFVFEGAARSEQPQRDTATNTRRTNEILGRIENKLTPSATGNFGNL